MEEKKLDINSIIGFVLIFGILLWMLYNNQPTPEELEAQEKAKQEQVEAEKKDGTSNDDFVATPEDFNTSETTEIVRSSDSTKLADVQSKDVLQQVTDLIQLEHLRILNLYLKEMSLQK